MTVLSGESGIYEQLRQGTPHTSCGSVMSVLARPRSVTRSVKVKVSVATGKVERM